MYWGILGILLIVSAACCAVGFKKFVYFLSIGYGFAVAGCGIAALVLAIVNKATDALPITIFQCIVFVLYGARLSGFLLAREIKNASYRKVLSSATGNDKKMPVFVLICMWLMCAVLYVAQVSPMVFRAFNGCVDTVVPCIGVVLSIIGLTLETLADLQKSEQKKENPHKVATKGLYSIVRCPNYFGEILFWTGVFVAGITAYANAGQWIVAVVAYVAIVYIMFNGAKRLETRQLKSYGDDPEYKAYTDKTPIILPLIPLYHLAKPETAKQEDKKEDK